MLKTAGAKHVFTPRPHTGNICPSWRHHVYVRQFHLPSCYSEGCSIAQLVACWPAVWQGRVQIPARHSREIFPAVIINVCDCKRLNKIKRVALPPGYSQNLLTVPASTVNTLTVSIQYTFYPPLSSPPPFSPAPLSPLLSHPQVQSKNL